MSDDQEEYKRFTVDGVVLNVFVGVSPCRKHVEYVIEGQEPLSPLLVGKVLEVLSSNALKGVHVPVQIYAKEMN